MQQKSRDTRRLWFTIVAILLGTIGAMVASELAVRLLLPTHVWQFRDATDDWQLDSRIGWTQKGGLEVKTRTDSGDLIEFRTNGDGLQPSDAARTKSSGISRVLMLGDSTIVGRSVPEQARVHRQLESLLRARGIPAQVLNAGVQGYSTDQELLSLELLGSLYRPDVVILAICTNDFLQNEAGSAYGLNKPKFVRNAKGDLQYVPPVPQEQISRFGGGLAAMLQYSALYRALQPAVLRIRAALGNWRERNLLGMADELYYSPAAINGIDWELFEKLLVRMRGASDAIGARFFVYMHPAIDEIWESYIAETIRRAGLAPGVYDRHAVEKKVAALASRNGIRFVPLIDRFLMRANEGPFHLLPRDPHCNEVCYRITSQILADAITSDRALRGGRAD